MKPINLLENLEDFASRYIYDENGNKIAVVMTPESLVEFLEEVEDLYEICLVNEDIKNGAESFSHEEVMESLTRE